MYAGRSRASENLAPRVGWEGVVRNTDEMMWMPESLDEFARTVPKLEPLIATIRQMIPPTLEKLGNERLAWLRNQPRIQRTESVALGGRSRSTGTSTDPMFENCGGCRSSTPAALAFPTTGTLARRIYCWTARMRRSGGLPTISKRKPVRLCRAACRMRRGSAKHCGPQPMFHRRNDWRRFRAACVPSFPSASIKRAGCVLSLSGHISPLARLRAQFS